MSKKIDGEYYKETNSGKHIIIVRAKIWKSKLQQMQDERCQMLADKFDFSGGQIDNIIRKSEIQEIVHGTVINFEQIQSFCNEESISINRTKIGFGYAHD